MVMMLSYQQAYDHSLTFASEKSLIWSAPWTFPKVLYILSRYWSTATLDIILYCECFFRPFGVALCLRACQDHFSHGVSVKSCLTSERFVTCNIIYYG